MKQARTKWKAVGFALIGCVAVAVVAVSMASGATNSRVSPNTKGKQTSSQAAGDRISFEMVRSAAAAAAGCLPNAGARVTVRSAGPVEVMDVFTHGLPANTEFDFFVIQVPNTPFGLSWYQGDLETKGNDPRTDSNGHGTFIGRFNIETFIVAPGTAPAPVVHNQPPFPDASSNPQTAPVHTFHLGLWFNDPADAVKAGCPGNVTPFNGDHNAGIQALSTRNFPNDQGPLRQLAS
jgi:hypothetical protein